MSKQNNKHPDPGTRQIDAEDKLPPTAGQHQPDIQDGKNRNKRNNSPQQRDPEDESNLEQNGEVPEERSPDTSSSL